MPRGVYERQPTAAAEAAIPASEPVKMIAMKLLRHYRPQLHVSDEAPDGVPKYEVVGYLKKEVTRKFPDGQIKVIEPEEFIPGEKAPPPFPGVLNEHKIWAGTTIRVPEAEAKAMRLNGIAERAFDD